jgi:HK97 family phage prohead protease
MSISVMASRNNDFRILKSDELMIGGYASIEVVDKQNDLITLEALNTAVKKFMDDKKFRNVMTNHSNVQVGEVIDSYRDKSGKLWKSEVDDVGFFVVIKLRDDIEKAKEVGRGIRKGTLRSFSIGGQALQKVKKSHGELGEYNEISKLELHEVTICEKGINPEAKFDILKRDKGDEKMSDKLEKALNELDILLKEVEGLKGDEEETAEYADSETDENMELADEETDSEEFEDEVENMGGTHPAYDDKEGKAYLRTLDGAGNQIGEPADRIVINNGKPTSTDMPVVKAFSNGEFDTLNLSNSNIEKAYEAFRQEQLESLAYDNLRKSFETRFESEKANRENVLAKSQYDAQAEIASMKQEFSDLRKSLTAEKDSIIKAQEESVIKMPSIDEISSMDWSDIHKMVNNR